MLIRRLLSSNLFSIDVRTISICVIGSGPAGFYCAQNLLKVRINDRVTSILQSHSDKYDILDLQSLPSSTIDIYDKLPVPFGLVRFGVAPDHPEVKNVINTFSKIGSDPRVKFIGNVTLGRDVLLEDLKIAYNAVVLVRE